MKNYLLPSLFLAAASLSWAVPAEINYQGRLTDANGDPVTGDVSMSLKMFDAATAGNELYSEDIGTVTLDDNGVYSFQFGANGQSVVATSETIATTDGTSSIFNTTLGNLPVDGSVSVSDGTYTWSQANGSSSSTEFIASLTPSSGAISIIYLNGVPTSNVDITASYNYLDATVAGALSSHENHWLELTVDGQVQTPRERILSVPFAQVAERVVNRRKFGSYIAIEKNPYRAETDGFIIFSDRAGRGNCTVRIDGITVVNNYNYNSDIGGMVPIAAGQTCNISGYAIKYFMPVMVE